MQSLRITRLHQLVRGRQMIVLQPGDRIDGVRHTKAGDIPVTEVTHLKRLLTPEEYGALVKAGVIEEPDASGKRGKKGEEGRA